MNNEDSILEVVNTNSYYEISHISVDDLEDISNFTVKRDYKTGRKRGYGLVLYLQKAALFEEEFNLARTYIIRDKETNMIAGYFSLKTGLVTEKTSLTTFDNITGIEIANLAVNETYKEAVDKNNKLDIQHLGKYFFSQFIYPLIREISKYVGVKYIYCFALPEKSLIRHYTTMGFQRVTKRSLEKYIHRHIRPEYDRNCIFMYQEL
ncbi:MAG: hypothetical protein J5929_05790 [Eubacterium sp.]|nr:hypothetical protein [Eubacterium sp.]